MLVWKMAMIFFASLCDCPFFHYLAAMPQWLLLSLGPPSVHSTCRHERLFGPSAQSAYHWFVAIPRLYFAPSLSRRELKDVLGGLFLRDW